MFAEYAQVATYVSNQQPVGTQAKNVPSGGLPAYLRPSFQSYSNFGHKENSVLPEDFIMLAEFSELEGPKPVVCIHKCYI